MGKAKYFLIVAAAFFSIQYMIRDAGSCSAPVFRYALERWKPDPYKGVFIHRGELTDRDQKLLQQLEEVSLNPDYPLNLRVREVNADTFPEEKLREILKGPVPQKLPVLAVWYPDQMGERPPLWMLELTPAVLKALTDSPMRKQLAESLINGESVIWIFVPSGNAKKDEKAKALIQQELDLALNDLVKTPFFVLAGSGERKLNYGFSVVTLSRSDPEERFFLDMLLNCESDLHEFENEPMVFPVFGRGRVLGCLFGEYISKKNIRGVVTFLAASCSCEIKSLNPGKDLLMAALWDRVVMGDLFVEDDTPLPELTGVMPEAPKPVQEMVADPAPVQEAVAGPEPVQEAVASPEPIRETAADSSPPEKNAGLFKIYGITFASIVVVVAFAGLILTRRRKED